MNKAMNNSSHTTYPATAQASTRSSSPSLAAATPATESLYSETERLLAHLHRGGRYAHLWTSAGNRSYWFSVNRRSGRTGSADKAHNRRYVPKRWVQNNIYFSVHPLAQIPPQSTSGRRERRFISSQLPYLCAINTLFAEFDGKDYVLPLECGPLLPADFRQQTRLERQQAVQAAKETLFYRTPQRYKARALHFINDLALPPSIMIDSGGGYHCYWLLDQTVPLDETNRADVQALQHGWVQLVGADQGAADLRRMLRLPGTYNYKVGFGKQPPRVHFVKADFGLLYRYDLLESTVNDWLYARQLQRQRRHPRQPVRHPTTVADATRSEVTALRQRFNDQHPIVDLLTAHGYQLSFAQEKVVRLARPGRKRSESSVTVFPARRGGPPELSVHFSTNDPLYSRDYIDESSGQLRRKAHDAFAIYVMLEHEGDWAAAYRALAGEQRVVL